MRHSLRLSFRWMVVDKQLLKLHKAMRSAITVKHTINPRSCFAGYHVPNKGPWVAKIVGTDPKYGLDREFQRAEIDYTEVVDKREVYRCWVLEEGPIYEVKEDRPSGRELRRYFIRWVNGVREELTKEQVLECLLSSSESVKTS